MSNAANYLASSKIRSESIEVLDEDMRPTDLVDVLRRLKFDYVPTRDRHGQYCLVWLDRPVRDYLIAMLTDHRR